MQILIYELDRIIGLFIFIDILTNLGYTKIQS